MMKMYRSEDGRHQRPPDGEWDKWFEQYGWTWIEFSKHWVEWNGGQGTYSDYEKSKQ
jgi:hypothetical protein